MSLLRSERMGYYNIIMPRESAWEVMNELGELSAVQFVDLNSKEQVLSRQFSGYIRRCEEIELKIHTIEQLMIKFKKPVERCTDYKAFLKNLRELLKKRNKAEHTYLDEVEAELEERLASLSTQIKYYDGYVESHNTIVEQIHVLEEAQVYFADDAEFPGHDMSKDEEAKDVSFDGRVFRFQYLAGVIDQEDSLRFRRVLFRATLGMVWSTMIDIDPQRHHHRDDVSFVENSRSDQKRKSVFLIAYPGGEQNILKTKLNKIADSFGAHKYGIPQDKTSFNKKLVELKQKKEDGWRILEITKQHIDMQLDALANSRHINETWPLIESFRLFVLKEKAIYHNLNMLKQQNTVFHGNLWCPFYFEERVKRTLDNLSQIKPHLTRPEFEFAERPENSQPPTFFRTNDFTAPFQEIVNTYGIPRYQEINPGLFTIATFPFLFGVMFGDIGHGAALFAFGLYLCFNKDEILKDKGGFSALIPARYLVAMLGFFALYCGFIYNDFMALPLNIFGSCYEEIGSSGILFRTSWNCVYPFGLDPTWYGASNELAFFNSFKMKMAIILGVSQMILGTMLKMLNSIFFRSKLDFFFEWLPQITFLCCTFGYMVVLIFLKWATPYGVEVGIETSAAPAIINIFIKFVLSMGKFDTGTATNIVKPLYGDNDGASQSATQKTLLILAVLCVPLMLLPKPIILNYRHKQLLKRKGYMIQSDDQLVFMQNHKGEEDGLGPNNELQEIHSDKRNLGLRTISLEDVRPKQSSDHNDQSRPAHSDEDQVHHKEETFGDLFVHQLIETIEFVLGSVSHTASYLRLWALSLAHSQLAKVFFNYTIAGAMETGSVVTAFFGFAVFGLITFFVLLCMDLMECFLHALRLHWVEFQSKFYKADGYLFDPFSFQAAMSVEIKN